MKEHATEEHLNESILNEEILEDQKKNRIDHMTYLPGMEDPGSDIMDQVVEASKNYDYDSYTAADVRRALQADPVTPKDFAALLSPAALPFLEEIAQAASARPESTSATALICLRRCTLPTTARTTAFTVDLTVTTRFAVRCLTQSRSTWKWLPLPNPDSRKS